MNSLQLLNNTNKYLTSLDIFISLFLNPNFIEMMYIFQPLPEFDYFSLLAIYNFIIHLTLSSQSLNPGLIRIHMIALFSHKMRLDKIISLAIRCFGCDIIGVVCFAEDGQFWGDI